MLKYSRDFYLAALLAKDVHRFYMPGLSSEENQTLEGNEAAHAGRVLRLQSGDEVIILNGKGRAVRAEITEMSKKSFVFCVLAEVKNAQNAPSFHLAIAPTKNIDRLEWCLEKCTEIGLGRVSLIICQNSERRKVRLDRLEKVAISAMKQSGSLFLPQIDEPRSLEQFLKENEGELLIAHCKDGSKEGLKDFKLPLSILIGPEGDFTKEELNKASDSGAKAVHLGEKRLRTETAAVVACTLMNL